MLRGFIISLLSVLKAQITLGRISRKEHVHNALGRRRESSCTSSAAMPNADRCGAGHTSPAALDEAGSLAARPT
jgi:hypothetical protein